MIAPALTEESLSLFHRFIITSMGLHFEEERRADLRRGIESAAKEFGFPNAQACVEGLMSAPLSQRQIEILASHLTIGETYFFRDKRTMDVLEKIVLPTIIRRRQNRGKRLRLWSAGCCTGEEPYSVAILLSKILPDIDSWNITILGTDINGKFLQKAADGLYGEWSFRGVAPGVQETYFTKTTDKRYELRPSIKKLVTFAYLNLAEDVFPSHLNHTAAIDLVICQNVLMYLTDDVSKKIIGKFHRSLGEKGWLFVSPAEASTVPAPFEAIRFQEAIFYRKGEDAIEEAALPAFHAFEPMPLAQETMEAEPSAPFQITAATPAAIIPFDAPASSAKETARLYANQGKLAEALEWSLKAITEDKLSAPAYYLHATILEEQGALDEASSALKRALYLDPNFVLAHFALGNVARKRHQFKDADRYWKNCAALLQGYGDDAVLPESEGIHAARLSAFLKVMDRGETGDDPQPATRSYEVPLR